MAGSNFRSSLIKIITFLGGIYFFLEFLLPASVLEAVGIADKYDSIVNGFIAVGSVAAGLGVINLCMVHFGKIAFMRTGWINSLALIFGMFLMMSVAILQWFSTFDVSNKVQQVALYAQFSDRIKSDAEKKTEGVKKPAERLKILAESLESKLTTLSSVSEPQSKDTPFDLQQKKILVDSVKNLAPILERLKNQTNDEQALSEIPALSSLLSDLVNTYGNVLRSEQETTFTAHTYSFLQNGLLVPLGAAMFALLGVYIASAAYRAFRIRSIESALMMSAAVLVMLGQIPQGHYISDSLPAIRQWLLEVPNSAAFRAIRIGASVAGLIMAYRMWLSIESESFSDEGEV